MKKINRYPSHIPIKIDDKIIRKIKKEALTVVNQSSNYRHYLVDGNVNIIPLISEGGRMDRLSGFSNGDSFKDTVVLKDYPVITEFINSIPGKKHTCRISIMEGETEIFPHRDYFRNLEFGVIRLHLPLQTTSKCIFTVEGKNIHLNTGHLHFVDISKIHSVKNTSKKERIHLIIDLEVTRELLEMFNFSPKAIEQFSYLTPRPFRKSGALRPAWLNIPIENLPYPLSLSSDVWKIVQKKKQWFFCSSTYKFKIIENVDGSFRLDAVGPGFSFFLTDKTCMISCSGITMLGDKQVYNGSKNRRVKLQAM